MMADVAEPGRNDAGDTERQSRGPASSADPISLRALVSGLLAYPITGPLFALIVVTVVFSTGTSTFLNRGNVSLIVQQSVVIGTLALGQTLVVLVSGIDLANGAIMVLGTVVAGSVALHGNAITGMALGLLVCVAVASVNGLVVTRLKLPPFIATLGMAGARPDPDRGSERLPDRQPRQHHGRGDRRHQPVRRPWRRRGDLRRGSHRRRPQERTDTSRHRFALPADRDRRSRDRGRCGRPGSRAGTAGMTDAASSSALALQAIGLTKRYGHIVALDGADFELARGEILAVVGDNGAGKSTLIKALTGAVIPDAGEVVLSGGAVNFRSPLDARLAGIETVYQELAVATELDITQNLFLGRELRKPGLAGTLFRQLDKARMRRQASEQMSRLGIRIQSIRQKVETLSGGQRQAVAVARAAAWGRKVIILDEPTAALGVRETHQVLDLIARVRQQGLSVVLISHSMPEVFAIANRIHIHRLGRRATIVSTKAVSMNDVVAVMTGALGVDAVPSAVIVGPGRTAAAA